MQDVRFADETAGNLNWELPVEIVRKINALPTAIQEEVRRDIDSILKEFCLILLAGTVFRDPQYFYNKVEEHLGHLLRDLKRSQGN